MKEETTEIRLKKFPKLLYRQFKAQCNLKGINAIDGDNSGAVQAIRAWVDKAKGKEERWECSLMRCPACGYYGFNGIECFDCGYRP